MTTTGEDVEIAEEVKITKEVEVEEAPADEVYAKSDEVEWKDALSRYPMREISFYGLHFNPVTSLVGIVVLWGVAIWCMIKPGTAKAELIGLRQESALYFTWFYIGTRPVWMFFIFYIGIRYGDVRLGPKDSKPEFSAMSYFAMLFAAGVAVGLFFYGVSEPLWHQGSHWYGNEGYHTQDAIDQFAINMTLYHWGLSAWAGYLVVAIACGLAAYRFNLPMTFRSGLYPILGEYTWGWIGDLIDGLTIVVTVAGVCTSLGLGAMQIVTGLQRVGLLDDNASENSVTNAQILTIWIITLIATASVLSGLHFGIKFLSDIAFSLGMIILFLAFIYEHTPYLLNVLVQSTGYYLQHTIFQIGFWTDAFGQLREGEGRAVDGKAAAVWWMDAWTVFYMAWWTAWSGFVGLFVARISKGRTLREVTLYGFLCPMFYCIIWFGIFGGIGLRQSRQALEMAKLGEEHFGDAGKYLVEGSKVCYNVPQEDVSVDGEVVFTNYLKGITPVCAFDSDNADSAWFNVMYSFTFPNDFSSGLGGFMSIISIIAIGIYFITSSDSGSLIVDHLASNGHEEHHWFQRLFWALTEGTVACVLLAAGGSDGLQALQAGSVISGLPFTVIMCYMLQSIYVMCERAEKTDAAFYVIEESNDFTTPVYGGIFNIFEFLFSFGMVHEKRVARSMDLPSMQQVVVFFQGIFIPFVPLYQILTKVYPRNNLKNIVMTSIYAFMFVAWIVLFIFVSVGPAFRGFGWTAFFINGLIVCNLKQQFRQMFNIRGNVIGDFFSGVFFYPQTFVQLLEQCTIIGLPLERVD